MLSRYNRLRVTDFSRVYKHGIRGCGAFICVHFIPLQHNNVGVNFQCACTVGKKNIKSAVRRNRVRRRLYGVVEQMDLVGFDGQWIIHAVKPVTFISSTHLSRDIYKVMLRLSHDEHRELQK